MHPAATHRNVHASYQVTRRSACDGECCDDPAQDRLTAPCLTLGFGRTVGRVQLTITWWSLRHCPPALLVAELPGWAKDECDWLDSRYRDTYIQGSPQLQGGGQHGCSHWPVSRVTSLKPCPEPPYVLGATPSACSLLAVLWPTHLAHQASRRLGPINLHVKPLLRSCHFVKL